MTPSLVLGGRGQGAGKSHLPPSTFHRLPPSGFPHPASRYPAFVHVHLQVHESFPLPPLASHLPPTASPSPISDRVSGRLAPACRGYGDLPSPTRPKPAAFALVATLMMIAVITGAAVAFFQSTRIERLVSRNYADLARARLAADGALAHGQALITSLFTNYPDSAVGWARLADTELTTFYFRTTNANGFLTNGANAATPASQPVFLFAHPLASGANAAAISSFTTSSVVFTNTNTPGGQAGLNTTNRIDLNGDNWIGTPPGGTKPQLNAKWVEILQDPGAAKNTNLNAAGVPINPPIARYAFWAEDESFRVNINRAKATPRGATSPGTNVSEICLSGATDANFAGQALSLQTSLRSNIPSPGLTAVGSGATAYQNNKFVLSTYSSALNFSRGGTLRLNLNAVVANPAGARVQMDQMISAITNSNTLAPPSNSSAMPLFGQRFYRENPNTAELNSTSRVAGLLGTVPRTEVYLQRLAANLLDAIDTDSRPTVVNANRSIRTTTDPVNQTDGVSDILAFGKEAGLFLTEYGQRVVKTKWTPGAETTEFEFSIYHTFEFWNPTSKSLSLAQLGNPTLQVFNLYDFDVGFLPKEKLEIFVGTNAIPIPHRASPPVLTLPFSGFSGLSSNPNPIPPNGLIVLTTDPSLSGTDTNIFVNPNGTLRYQGFTTKTQIQAKLGSSAGRAGSPTTDYDIGVFWYNPQGLLGSFVGLATVAASPPLTINQAFNQDFYFCSLRGNTNIGYSGRSGDPRSINDQMEILKYVNTTANVDQTRFYNASAAQSSIARFNATFTFPNNWPDWSPANLTGQNFAPFRQQDAPLDTIGRLGDVADPGFIFETGGIPENKRGGGRTLKIGQAERFDASLNNHGLWDGSETSQSRNWAAWRLADVFTANTPCPPWPLSTPPANPVDWNGNGSLDTSLVAAYGTSELEAATRFDGVVNINGALRDNGAALQALAFGLTYESSPDGAQTTSARNLNVANLVNTVRNHLSGGTLDTNPSNDRLFWERGQVSELADNTLRPILSYSLSSGANALVPGVALATTQDRGREELVRRMIDLITTKGNTYTIYAIGQSLNPRTGQPVSTQRMKRTFRINPVFDSPLPADSTFNPSLVGTGSANDRFRRPSRFTNSILYTGPE